MDDQFYQRLEKEFKAQEAKRSSRLKTMLDEAKETLDNPSIVEPKNLSGQSYPLIFGEDTTFKEALLRLLSVCPEVNESRILINGKHLGWDIALDEKVLTYQDCQFVITSPLDPYLPYKRLKWSLFANEYGIQWPVWEDEEECPINKEKLGTLHDPNQVENLVFFKCGSIWKAANKSCLACAIGPSLQCPLCREDFSRKRLTITEEGPIIIE